ncbi:MAG: Lrp/AsnC ligand binding domain-containing protein [Thermoplasmata archaeon]
MSKDEKADFEQAISRYYGDDQVKSIIQIKVETKEADTIAEKVSMLPEIEDLFLVTGEADLIAKVRFENYNALKRFIVEKLSKIDGVRDTRTLMVVTTFKEGGKLRAEEEKS